MRSRSHLAAEDADVVIADRLDEDVAAPVVGQIEAAGRKALFVSTDVSDEELVRAMVDRTYEEFGDVDILVYNAGTVSQSFFHEVSEQAGYVSGQLIVAAGAR